MLNDKELALAVAAAKKLPRKEMDMSHLYPKNLPRGVTFTDSGRFRARSNRDGEDIHLGTFDRPEQAEAAVKQYERNLEQ